MKNWYREEYSFKITVESVGSDGSPKNCRNSHEVGDTYDCGYGCPGRIGEQDAKHPTSPGEFCSKSMAKLFPLMEAVRAGGDLSNLLADASKHSGEFYCPDGVALFKLEALRNE